MSAHPNSPNAKWVRHGYRVERLPRRGAGGHKRIIRNPAGEVVLQGASHAEELAWIRNNLEVTA